MILYEMIRALIVVECNVWWLLLGLCIFSFFLGRMVMYLWIIHRTYVAKSCGGSCTKLAMGCVLFWLNLSCIIIVGYL